MSVTELDDLLERFAGGERTWELAARLAAVLSAAGRIAEIPAVLAACTPRNLESVGAVRVSTFEDPDLGLTGWRLPPELGGTAILDVGDVAHEVRAGDRFVIDFGGMSAAVGSCPVGYDLMRGETSLVRCGVAIDAQTGESPEAIRDSLTAALKTIAATCGATVEE